MANFTTVFCPHCNVLVKCCSLQTSWSIIDSTLLYVMFFLIIIFVELKDLLQSKQKCPHLRTQFCGRTTDVRTTLDFYFTSLKSSLQLIAHTTTPYQWLFVVVLEVWKKCVSPGINKVISLNIFSIVASHDLCNSSGC